MAEQQELVPRYTMRCGGDSAMHPSIKSIAEYLLPRYGPGPGRVQRAWFQGRQIGVSLDERERRNFLRFLKNWNLKQYLTFDDGAKKYDRKTQ